MNKIEKLIQELCPEGVEFRALGEISTNKNYKRIPITQSNRKSGKYRYFGASGVVDYVDNYIFEGDYLLISEDGANLLARKTPIAFSVSGKFWVNNHAHVIEFENYNTRRLVEIYLNSIDLSKFITGAAQPKLNQDNLNKILIPIPPLPIQQEIVNILGKFTQLEEDLRAELEARRKQYEYYLNQLMEFEGKEIEWVEIGKIGHCYAGATPKTRIKEYWENGTIPWMSSGEVNYGNIYETEKKITQMGFNNSSTKMIPANSVVIALAGQGRTRGTVAITRIPLCTNQSLCSVVTGERVKSEFLYYFLKTQYSQLRNVSSGDGTRGGLNLQMIRDYKIPIPPLSEQERIVSILDKFEALVNDSSIGLQAEIEARRKQFEYYRNKLLTFAEYE